MLSITGLTLEQFAELLKELGFEVKRELKEKPKGINSGSEKSNETIPVENFDLTKKESVEVLKNISVSDSTEAKSDQNSISNRKKLSDRITEVSYIFKIKPRNRTENFRKSVKSRFIKEKELNKSVSHKKKSENLAVDKNKKNQHHKKLDPDNPFSVLMKLKTKNKGDI